MSDHARLYSMLVYVVQTAVVIRQNEQVSDNRLCICYTQIANIIQTLSDLPNSDEAPFLPLAGKV